MLCNTVLLTIDDGVSSIVELPMLLLSWQCISVYLFSVLTSFLYVHIIYICVLIHHRYHVSLAVGGVKKDGLTCVFNFGDDTWGSSCGSEGGNEEEETGGLFAAMGMFDDNED